MSSADAFYVTTPIYYVNDVPHIGHAYTTLACDAIARFARLDGRRVFFLTGTDEHGQKVEQAAAARGHDARRRSPTRCRSGSATLADRMRLTHDDFIRTTEERHKRGVQALWRELVRREQIYLGTYAGWYSVRDESFYAESELVDGRRPDRGAGRMGRGAELLLPPVGVAGAAAAPLRRAPGLRAAAGAAQRGGELRQRRPAGPVGLAHELPLGHPGAGRPRPRHLRLARRAHQLHDRARLSGPGGGRLSRPSGRPTCTSSARTSCAFTRSTGRPSCSPPGSRRRGASSPTAGGRSRGRRSRSRSAT